MSNIKHNKNYFHKYPKEYNSYSSLYRVFASMIDRCNNPNVKNYHNYGGRGIKVCKEWLGNYQAFCDWALSNGYKKGLQIDRIDNNGNYDPSNCRWVTRKENSNNTRSNTILTYNGQSHTISQWSDILKINKQTISYRLRKGWDAEKIFTTPIDIHCSFSSRCRTNKSRGKSQMLNKTTLRKIIKWTSSKFNEYSKEEVVNRVYNLKPSETLECRCGSYGEGGWNGGYKYKFVRTEDNLFVTINEKEIVLNVVKPVDQIIKEIGGESESKSN